ncbi:MAG: red chlorophyll catabolite reductase [Chloroflexales bacterium]|nr:red chlorophyll catabolite reductase [Chloroflexales bacterium]
MLAAQPTADASEARDRLWAITGELRGKLLGRFELTPGAAAAPFRVYSTPDRSCRGEMLVFSGAAIDYMASAWIGNPSAGFSNLHLNIWLRPHLRVPNLSIVFGTVPDLFFFADYVPRADLWTDLEYLDRYYEPVNRRALELRADDRLRPFISQSVYIRQAQSPCALCFTAPLRDDTLALAGDLAHEMLDRWLTWMDSPEPTPEHERSALARRDLAIRRATALRDPANSIGERMFGKAYARKLLEALWGVSLESQPC